MEKTTSQRAVVCLPIGKATRVNLGLVKNTKRRFEYGRQNSYRYCNGKRFGFRNYARGLEVIIAAAGGAAHLAGVMAAWTTLPVIGVPIETQLSGGLDSLLSMVQMPSGVPVATVATGKAGAKNSAILAAQILGVKYSEIREKVKQYKEQMANEVEEKDRKLKEGKSE
ncbi:MAG: 5-(carboxyamino)imidazole ribonucleotide mutase [Candidatus Omnitrophota bacterium]|nr:5-(carboxyamino)imidazole ribonucleotide mutase [Candidatus Omnitrophota bacterium]